MKRLRTVLVTLLALLLLIPAAVPAGANSALKSWRGADVYAVSLKENCPVQVLHEQLTIEVDALPLPDGAKKADGAVVTAEYTLKNPTDEAVSVRLFFPVGQAPAYGYEDGEYGVLVNGAPAEITRRFSYPGWALTDVDAELEKLRDEYAATDLLQPAQPVTVVSFRLEGFSGDAAAKLLYSGAGRAVVYDAGNAAYMQQTEDGGLQFGTQQGEICRVALFGDDGGTFTWTFTDGDTEAVLPGAAAEELGRQTVPFVRFAAFDAPENSPIGPVDRFNAAVEEFSDVLRETSPGEVTFTEWLKYASDSDFMEWYEYELTFAPGETLTNTVTAPFFPDVDMNWEPYKYEYTYLLSPAAGWASFGGLDVEVRTPYHLLDASLKDFSKTETGWALHADGLPEKELELTLCASDAPVRDNSGVFASVLVLAQIAAGLLAVPAVIVVAALLIRHFVKKRKAKSIEH